MSLRDGDEQFSRFCTITFRTKLNEIRSTMAVLGFNCNLYDVSTVHRPIETKILSLPISTRVAQEKEHYVSSWIRLDCPKKLLCTVLESPGPSILSKERFVVSNEGNALVIVRTQAKLVS